MKIILSSALGFCSGVQRAIEKSLEQTSPDGADLNTLGQLVHNPQTVSISGVSSGVPKGIFMFRDSKKLFTPS